MTLPHGRLDISQRPGHPESIQRLPGRNQLMRAEGANDCRTAMPIQDLLPRTNALQKMIACVGFFYSSNIRNSHFLLTY
ncbi:hypothetical protein [Rhodoferax ferrireducens]|nr:hypothetical protein [Rhodoferax ferrireducens]